MKCFKKDIVKYISAVLICVMIMSLVGCGSKKEEDTTETVSYDDDLVRDADGFITVKDYVETTQDEVKIRRTPEEDGDLYITLDSGVSLTRTGIRDEWTRVLLNGGNYYVQSKYLKETSIKWATENDVEKVTHVVFIDPAKQVTDDPSLEAVNPELDMSGVMVGTNTNAVPAGMKAKMSQASLGVSSGAFEYEITMNVANYLNAELVKRGYTVYMSRDVNNVNISNAKRAEMANACDAEIYIKLEAAAANDPSASGVLGFITTSSNLHTGTMYQYNYELCYDVLKKTCEGTGASRLGIYETDDLSSLNYCDMPATVINMGFLSNEFDDAALTSDDYQKTMAKSIAEGIDLYFQEIEE